MGAYQFKFGQFSHSMASRRNCLPVKGQGTQHKNATSMVAQSSLPNIMVVLRKLLRVIDVTRDIDLVELSACRVWQRLCEPLAFMLLCTTGKPCSPWKILPRLLVF